MTPVELVPGIHRIRLPLPFELNHINLHLVRLADGYLLIDCGLNSPESFQALRDSLDALGVSWQSIRQILLTHMHPDHSGLASKLLELTGARLLMHRVEVRLLAEAADDARRLRWLDQVMRDAGVPAALTQKVDRAFGGAAQSFRKLEPDWVLEGGETVPTAAGSLKVLWTPGHSPGHVCLYARRERFLIAGDLILDGITPNIGWLPERDALADYLASLDAMERLEVGIVLPSHGDPLNDHRAWIRATRRHHDERCRLILEAVAASPRTAHEVVGELWKTPLAPFHHRFAIWEVLAHLQYLANRNRLAVERRNGAFHWRAASAG